MLVLYAYLSGRLALPFDQRLRPGADFLALLNIESLAARGRSGLGAKRGSPMLGAPTAASKGIVTVWAKARLRAAAQSRQIFAPGGHSRPQILHVIVVSLVAIASSPGA